MPENSISERLEVNNFSPTDEAAIIAAIAFAEAESSLFANLAENWLAANPDRNAIVNSLALGSMAVSDAGIVFLSMRDIERGYYIDNSGNAVADSILSVVIHEFVHAFSTLGDLEAFDTDGDGTVDDFVNLRNYRGETVELANQIYSRVGVEQQNSYVGFSLRGVLTEGFDYTNGVGIDRSWVSNAILGEDIWNSSFVGNSDDLLISGALDSMLSAGRGDDFLYGQGGDDRLIGGRGRDFLSGGADEDVLNGGNSHDILVGGDGFDRLNGGNGTDLLLGSDFESRFDTEQAPDRLRGGAGDDVLVASAGGADLYGDAGNDFLFGGEGNDLLEGGAAGDYIYTGGGVDEVRGGAGNDWINALAEGSQATVYMDGNSGRDYIETGEGGWDANGIEAIVFEGLSSDDVSIFWDFQLVSSLEDVISIDEGTVLESYLTEIYTGTAYLNVTGTRATINIGEITLDRYAHFIYESMFPGANGLQGEAITARFEGNTALVFDNGTLNGGSSQPMIDYIDPSQVLGSNIPGPARDDGFFLWENVFYRSTAIYDNAPDQFMRWFGNEHIDDSADLYVTDLDLGLIVTDEVAGILI